MVGSIGWAMSIVTELVFWNELAKCSLGWKAPIAHSIVSLGSRVLELSETFSGSIRLPV